MSKQNGLDFRHGRQGGRIVPWRPMPKPGESVPAIVDSPPDHDERGQLRGQGSLFDDDGDDQGVARNV